MYSFTYASSEKKDRVCTMEYRPVCAKVRVNGFSVLKTFSNACVAISNHADVLYKGKCDLKRSKLSKTPPEFPIDSKNQYKISGPMIIDRPGKDKPKKHKDDKKYKEDEKDNDKDDNDKEHDKKDDKHKDGDEDLNKDGKIDKSEAQKLVRAKIKNSRILSYEETQKGFVATVLRFKTFLWFFRWYYKETYFYDKFKHEFKKVKKSKWNYSNQ